MSESIEFDPVDHITVGAIGEPGNRTFLLQATYGDEKACLVVEKGHILALADEAQELFANAGVPDPLPHWDAEVMAIDESLEPSWRVGSVGVGFTEETDQVLVVCHELVDEGEETATAQFWMSRSQLAALTGYGMVIASQGRPACPLCRNPMNPEGHYCVSLNGKARPER